MCGGTEQGSFGLKANPLKPFKNEIYKAQQHEQLRG